ncbi:MAG: hypothetical protein FWG11_07125 [Promicromonosporaceae bacterium]|nr:hypothetical protein [Promicromonosporaceae bacterium]
MSNHSHTPEFNETADVAQPSISQADATPEATEAVVLASEAPTHPPATPSPETSSKPSSKNRAFGWVRRNQFVTGVVSALVLIGAGVAFVHAVGIVGNERAGGFGGRNQGTCIQIEVRSEPDLTDLTILPLEADNS